MRVALVQFIASLIHHFNVIVIQPCEMEVYVFLGYVITV